MILSYFAIDFFTIFLMSALGTYLALRLLWKTGFNFIPQEMKDIYHSTKTKLAEAGWGQDNRPQRDEYPNRKENS